ncbi:MAG: phosphoribosylanthranilate isomerase [Oscillospiraceae bacterium]|nr:phosphoribosylanthranilate isomerase [Oscillospiraceae bacterium]
MTRVKICGLMRDADIDAVNACLPDFAGFVFAPSRRRVTIDRAATLSARLDTRIVPVGVFVDAAINEIAEIAERGVIRIAQLHGGESEDYIAELRRRADIPIIKAFRGGEATETRADYVLLDGVNPGSGAALDWSAIAPPTVPWFLAGGLQPENVRDATTTLNPYAVDVSSGVETDSAKDFGKIRKFIDEVRR